MKTGSWAFDLQIAIALTLGRACLPFGFIAPPAFEVNPSSYFGEGHGLPSPVHPKCQNELAFCRLTIFLRNVVVQGRTVSDKFLRKTEVVTTLCTKLLHHLPAPTRIGEHPFGMNHLMVKDFGHRVVFRHRRVQFDDWSVDERVASCNSQSLDGRIEDHRDRNETSTNLTARTGIAGEHEKGDSENRPRFAFHGRPPLVGCYLQRGPGTRLMELPSDVSNLSIVQTQLL